MTRRPRVKSAAGKAVTAPAPDQPAASPASDETWRDNRYKVPALEKGLDVLELLAIETGELSMTAIASRLERSVSELYRIVQYLEARGYLTRDLDNSQYSLSLKLFHLAHDRAPLRSLVSFAMPIMEALARETEQSCHLAILDGVNILVVAQVESPRTQRYTVRLGARLSVWESSSGTVLVSQLGDRDRDKLFRLLIKTVDPERLDAFRERVAEARLSGADLRPSHLVAGVTSVSRRIRNHLGHTVATLSIPFLHHARNAVGIQEADAALIRAAAALSRALGYLDEAAA